MRTHGGRPFTDLTGRRIHMLTVVEPLEERNTRGNVMWRCRCECGGEIAASSNTLLHGNIKSCGCLKKKHSQELSEHLTSADGAVLEKLQGKKPNRSSSTGVRGVYFIAGKYVAKLVFQGKQYVLGRFDTKEEAIAARKAADILMEQQIIEPWKRWKERADRDPEWAKENPVSIKAHRGGETGIALAFEPADI